MMRFWGKKNKVSDFWFPVGGFSGSRCIGSDRKKYELLSVLEAVINKRAATFGNAVPYILDKEGNEPSTMEARRLRELFSSPNALMSFQQLYRLTDIYRMIYGYCVWFTPRAYKGAIPAAILLIPPDKLSLEVGDYSLLTNELPEVRVRIDGRTTSITLDDLIIFNDIKTGFTSNPLLAQSRITALHNETGLLGSIAEAQADIIENRGAIGIISRDPRDDARPASVFEDNKKQIQEEYKRYGLSKQQWKVIITSASLRWTPLTMNIGDLKLIELEEVAAKKVCGIYDVPYELFPLSGNSTFENRRQAKLELYQDCTIPTSAGDAELITQKLGVKDLTVSFDYTHLPIFQEDQAAKASTVASISGSAASLLSSGIISIQEARALLSEYIDINPTHGTETLNR